MKNVALRYLESLDAEDTSPRFPLQPSLKYNASPSPLKSKGGEDLDRLEREMSSNVGGGNGSPSRTGLIRTRFESPSATVSSFKSPRAQSPGIVPESNTPTRAGINEKPAWMRALANKNAKLSPLKQQIGSATSNDSTSISQPSSPTKGNQGYEYLCRVQAIKNWMEKILQEEITQTPAELISYIRNGIHLAKLSNLVLPTTRKVFTNDSKLQFKHTENINRFFQLLDYMNVPDLFRFELTDLYDAKNVPKVWFCLHALSYTLSKSDPSLPQMEDLVGTEQFSDEDIKTATRALIGAGLPNFANASSTGNGESSYFNRALSPTKLTDLRRPSMSSSTTTKEQESPRVVQPPPVEITVQAPPEEEDPFREASPVSPPPEVLEYTIPEPPTTVAKDSTFYTPEIDEQLSNIVKIQSLVRGSNFRYRMFVDRIMLRSFGDELNELVSIIRGNLSRNVTIHEHRTELLFFKDDIIQLQAAARRKLSSRRRIQFDGKTDEQYSTLRLQSLYRAKQIRDSYIDTRIKLSKNQDGVLALQSLIRRNKIYQKSKVVLENKNTIESSLVELQSAARRTLYKRLKNTTVIKNSAISGNLVRFQSIIRGAKVRNNVSKTRIRVFKSLKQIHELQSIARGAISRTKLCNSVLITLIDEDWAFNELFAKVRGNAVRREVSHKKAVLNEVETSSIIPIQSAFRGIFVRFEKEVTMEDLYENIHQLIELQSITRAQKVRSQLEGIDSYYKSHIDQVIKAQAIIKSNFTQRAYKSLINMKNPPLSVIKRFAYLLTDNDVDYREEMSLAELKDQIIETSKSNEELEQQIENLDIKLSLLDKNKISVEEFLRHKNKYKTYRPSGSENGGITSSGLSINDQNLEKSSRDRLELYQSMFYLLQTNPIYFLRLLVTERDEGSDQLPALCGLISEMFPIKNSAIDHHSREEYFLVKFICSIMKNDIEQTCRNISDITKSQHVLWLDFFLRFNNHTYQRQHLKGIIGRIVTEVVEEEHVDFESDPSEIHRRIREREIKVHGSSNREASLAPQVAIKDPEVSGKFVENLMALREFTTDTLDLLGKNIHRIPLHIKIISRHAYELSRLQYPDKSDNQHLAVAGVILAKHYVAAIFSYPENYGIAISYSGQNYETPATRRTRENLKHLGRVLLQAFSLKPFSDNFLKPLNEYLGSNVDTVSSIIKRVIDVQVMETEYDLNQYDDVIAHERPRLTLKVSDMLQLAKLIRGNLEVVAPSVDDQLHAIATKIDDLADSARDFVALAELGRVTLSLNPTTQEESVHDSKTRVLFAQAKRSVLYIIRIQDGRGLLELLISGIGPQHEAKFREIVSQERREAEESIDNQTKKPYYKTSLGDLSTISYRDLKKMALEIILRLEKANQLTRKNSFQDLLNEIAVDIKTKHSRRISRKSHMEIAEASSSKLKRKEQFLKKQLADYNRHVEEVLSQLQSKPKDRKIFSIIPVFSKQYFYHRELRKNNRLPKFGSYKYSAKKLMDQGILKDFSGIVGQKYASSSKLDFMFSCHEAGKFSIEAASGSVNIPGAYNTVSLDELLNLQYESKPTLELFDGVVSFDTQNLMGFIFRKFYDVKRE
ncbi:ras GTPase-activating-like protein Iqg1p [[Candida] anglica]|uniref:Ras GTPase-activating-like protein Iqg1p n=1 Tax=[Candida] anglica TaxID=148631 RepID=A0ABP0E688_9ASCO